MDKPYSTIHELKHFLDKGGDYISTGGLYKKISNLVVEQILQKEKTYYTIHPLFINKVHALQKRIARAEEFFVSKSSTFFPKHIKMNRFIQTSFVWPYWGGLIASLSKEKVWYEYARHHAYLLSFQSEKHGYPNMVTKKTQSNLLSDYLCVVGTDSPLSQYGLSLAEHKFTKCKIGGTFLFDSQVRVMTIIGDYLIAIYVSEEFNKIVDSYIVNTSLEQHCPEYLQTLWQKETPCSIIIEHDPLKAKIWKRKINSYF